MLPGEGGGMERFMTVENFVLGPMGTNCYIVINDESRECFVTDPADCPPEFVSHIRNKGLKVTAVLLTHGHFDHIMGLDGLLEQFPVPVYAHENEKQVLESAQINLSGMYGMGYTFSEAEYVRDGQIIETAGMKIRVIHTPGHTSGGCCYYIEEEGLLLSGDTLFCASIGRTDFPTGSSSQLVRSVREKLMPLPDETRVCPGHMDETTIGYEKKHNPFL